MTTLASMCCPSDGRNAKAIVVCADIALYAPGSSGEPTQGAGAVAMLVEANPRDWNWDNGEPNGNWQAVSKLMDKQTYRSMDKQIKETTSNRSATY